jgi:hypothetical protein
MVKDQCKLVDIRLELDKKFVKQILFKYQRKKTDRSLYI